MLALGGIAALSLYGDQLSPYIFGQKIEQLEDLADDEYNWYEKELKTNGFIANHASSWHIRSARKRDGIPLDVQWRTDEGAKEGAPDRQCRRERERAERGRDVFQAYVNSNQNFFAQKRGGARWEGITDEVSNPRDPRMRTNAAEWVFTPRAATATDFVRAREAQKRAPRNPILTTPFSNYMRNPGQNFRYGPRAR